MRIRLPWPPPREALPLPNRSLAQVQLRLTATSSPFGPVIRHEQRPLSTVTPLQATIRKQLPSSQREQRSTIPDESASHKNKQNNRRIKQKPVAVNTPRKWLLKYLDRLDQFLPTRLRAHDAPAQADTQPEVATLLDILESAGRDLSHNYGESADLLSYLLIGQGRHEAVLHLIETLLQFAAAEKAANTQDELPSNLEWATPYMTALSEKSEPVQINVVKKTSPQSSGNLHSRYHELPSQKNEKAALNHVWRFLGTIVVRAAHSDLEDSKALLIVAHRALAKVHHLNLIPDNVYSYSHTHYSSTVQRPPILHLLSSRMLTVLSDAVWRASSDEAISEAASSGVPYQQLGKDPPGGRFRLKVRDLGPEAWLELILWCCVEGGYTKVGVDIIKSLQSRTEEPWFAVNWTGAHESHMTPGIDWDRVQNRSGGTVGRIEGYSSEAPLVDIPQRTISVEVVLAMVESFLTVEEFQLSARDPRKGIEKSRDVRHLIGFLEPHDLPQEYFDYLSLRMLQREDLDLAREPSSVHAWSSHVEWTRNLQSIRARPALSMDFRYQSIIGHSEARAGLLHQVLQAYLRAGFPTEAVEMFNEIQQLVDSSKAQAISHFISTPPDPSAGFFGSRVNRNKRRPDFEDSHGQLPPHKIAAFLNMVTENRLTRLGDWILYSDDVDGPVIPRSWYVYSSISTAITRYGGESSDHEALARAFKVMRRRKTKIPVHYLKALTDTYIKMYDLAKARICLSSLTQAIAGGYSASHLANLAGALLRLESSRLTVAGPAVANQTQQVMSLMTDILDGRYNAVSAPFARPQIIDFRQQIGHLLRIFDNITSPSLNEISARYMDSYPSRNAANLSPVAFDALLSAIVDCKGAYEGRRIWDLFCKAPVSTPRPSSSTVPISVESFGNDVDGGAFPEDVDVPESLENAAPMEDDRDPLTRASEITLNADFLQSTWSPTDLMRSVSRDDDPNPVVVPSIKTLRIISRGALMQRLQQLNKSSAQEQTDYDDILKWAARRFKAFGRRQPRTKEFSMSWSMTDGESEEGFIDEDDRVTSRERQKLDVQKWFTPRPFGGLPQHRPKKDNIVRVDEPWTEDPWGET